jgi:RNA-directed DNA polymerase
MAKGPSGFCMYWDCKGKEALVNTGEPLDWPGLFAAEQRVLRMQARLHLWAAEDPGRVFKDLHNLIWHPDFLTVAWDRVRGNKGARTAGVDRVIPAFISDAADVVSFLAEARELVKSRAFTPMPVRERKIPKPGQPGKYRRLGIPVAMDRLVQASLKLVLEPIFEADFKPVSYGFRPGRRAQDAIAEIHAFGSRGYHQVLEADIAACFDEIDHAALLGRVRRRIGDKRVLALVRAFLKSGIMTEGGTYQGTITGTPQGGILSPLLANIALSALDEHFHAKWEAFGPDPRKAAWTRANHRRRYGTATCRIVRYADDFVIMVHGSREQAEALREEVSAVLAPLGLRLAEAKTRTCHLDEGLDFPGWHIQRRRKRGTTQMVVYTYPAKKALASVTGKIRAITSDPRYPALASLLRRLNKVVRGWCSYFRHGVSSATFRYLYSYMWWRVARWLRKRHPRLGWRALQRRYLTGYPAHRPQQDGVQLFNPQDIGITRYRWRGSSIPTPWTSLASAAEAAPQA